MIFMYLFLIFLLGITLLYSLNKLKLVNLAKLKLLEKITIVMVGGILAYVLYLFIIGIMHIQYNFITASLPFWINIFVIVICIFKNYKKLNFSFLEINFKKENILIYLMVILVAINLLYLLSIAFSNNLLFPDEFSAWGLNPKNIFLGKKMNFFINTGLENYPNFLPLLSSGYYFFINNIQENAIRIFSILYLTIGFIGFYGFCLRKKINVLYYLVLFILVILTYSGISNFLTSSYCDIPFAITYSLGTLYLIEWFVNERETSHLTLSSINFMSCCFMRPDGLYLMSFNILLFIVGIFFSKKVNLTSVKLKSSIYYNLGILWLPILWKLYTIIEKYPTDLATGAGSSIKLHLEYLLPMFQSMASQFFGCIAWITLIFIFLIGWFFYYSKLTDKDKKIIILSSLVIVFNFVFLIFSYAFVFGAEAITAASFIRYMTRVVFLMLILSLLVIKPLDIELKIKGK